MNTAHKYIKRKKIERTKAKNNFFFLTKLAAKIT